MSAKKLEGTLIKEQNCFWSQSDEELLEFLKNELQKIDWGKAIIEGVPKDKVLVLQKWIKENKGKIEGVEVSIKPTLSGLTIEEEESFKMKYRSELACNRVKFVENEIEKIQSYIDHKCPDKWGRPPRLEAKLMWWKQKLYAALEQDKRNTERLEKEVENNKNSNKIIEKHSNIGKGKRNTDRKKLLKLIRKIDVAKTIKGEKPNAVNIEFEFMNNCNSYDTDKLEIEVFDQYFSYGKRGYVDFGNQFAKLLSNSRKL